MVKQYIDVELISPNSPAYLAWSRRQRRIHKGYKDSDKYKKDFLESDYQKAMRKWERVIRSLLSKITCEYENRILKYTERDVGTCYREIDFIAKPDANTLTFCEIKLKDRYMPNISSKKSGWSQLNKSTSIAIQKYGNLCGLSICVDMSYVYALENLADRGDFDAFMDISNYLLPSRDKKTIWLNPLAGNESYRHEVAGMKAAIPYIDVFAAVHNAESLQQISKWL